MVAGTSSIRLAARLPAHGFRGKRDDARRRPAKPRKRVVGAAKLERAHALQVLAFEMHARAG
jgi:hypothetical protein